MITKQQVTFTAVALTVATFLATVGPLWWWALAGMSSEVGSAWMLTDLILGSTAAFTWVWAQDGTFSD